MSRMKNTVDMLSPIRVYHSDVRVNAMKNGTRTVT